MLLVSEFNCPEKNGFFPDAEQCDLYYECVDNIPEPKLCPDGLLFESGNPNYEKCDYPFNIDCGDREFVRESIMFNTDKNRPFSIVAMKQCCLIKGKFYIVKYQ